MKSSIKDDVFADIILRKEKIEDKLAFIQMKLSYLQKNEVNPILEISPASCRSDLYRVEKDFLSVFFKNKTLCYEKKFSRNEIESVFTSVTGLGKGSISIWINENGKWVEWGKNQMNPNLPKIFDSDSTQKEIRGEGIYSWDDSGIITSEGKSIPIAFLSFVPHSEIKKAFDTEMKVIFRILLLLFITSLVISFILSILYVHRSNLLQTLKEEQEKLINQSKLASLGEMAAGIAHEINNPLTIISFQAQNLMRISPDEKVKKVSKTIIDTSHRAAKIVKGMKIMARDGHNDPFAKVGLSELISDVLALSEEKIKKANIEISISQFSPDIAVNGKVTQLSQVLLNLISNAKDALENCEERKIMVSVNDLGGFIELVVEDSGPGIPESIQAKIFQPFFTTKEPGKGTGLGLSIINSIVTDHGGKIVLNSRKGSTVFKIELPKWRDIAS